MNYCSKKIAKLPFQVFAPFQSEEMNNIIVGCVVYSRLTKIEELVINHNELEVFVQSCFTFCFNFYLFVLNG